MEDLFLLVEEQDKIPQDVYQITWHQIPLIKKTIGYAPKSGLPSLEALEEIKNEAKKHKAIFVKFEPNVKTTENLPYNPEDMLVRGKPLFTKFTFILDLKPKIEEIMKGLNQKTRYNVRLAERKGVKIVKDNSQEAFEEYWKLTEETTKRQGFYSHTRSYHQKMWRVMTESGMGQLFKAVYEGEVLTTWMIFVLNQKLYYPYGASTNKHRELMANNLMMWEVIKYGKEKKCTEFDMWGSLGENPDQKDSWYGFHKFKQGYGADLVEFLGTYDLVVSYWWYRIYNFVEKIRWMLLKAIKR